MNARRRRVATIGAGYVGLVTAVGLASLGHTVELVERRRDRLESLQAGKVPIHEPGLQEAFTRAVADGRLVVGEQFSDGVEAVLVCVGTPIGKDGRSDLSQIQAALEELRDLPPNVPVVIRSTMPPGGTQMLVEWSGIPAGQVVTNPEFLRQGSALVDFLQPSRIVIGRFPGTPASTIAFVDGLFDQIAAPRLVVDVAASELIKNGANAFLALKLSFTNEMASLSEEYGADIDEVLSGLSLDPRIGSSYMRPSYGFGGSCLPKELKALAATGIARGLPMHVTKAGSSANAASQDRFVDRIDQAVDGLRGRKIGILGLAFKAGTDDTRDSPAMYVAARLIDAGALVTAFDPEAGQNAMRELPELRQAPSADAAVGGADAVVIATEWPEFRALDWARLGASMASPIVIDGRRLLDPVAMRAMGYRYVAVGSPIEERPAPIAVTPSIAF